MCYQPVKLTWNMYHWVSPVRPKQIYKRLKVSQVGFGYIPIYLQIQYMNIDLPKITKLILLA